MSTVRFQTNVGDDRIIRLPPNVILTPGEVDVTVVQPDPAGSQATPAKAHWSLVEELARAAQELGIGELPSDLAENHDHYAHGAAKGLDRS